MTPAELHAKLNELMALPAETEWVEFKEARGNYDFDDLGRYFSALSNEANLKGGSYAWLVFGVSDDLREIRGSNYRHDRRSLDRLKFEISQHTNHQLTFVEIHDLRVSDRRVVMFQIPSAPRGVPTTWKGRAYGRQGESLGILNIQEIEQIRGQSAFEDWSAQICNGATFADLDPMAIGFAREQYKEKNRRQIAEIDEWDDVVFLNKARLCVNGQITNTAIILLGKPESTSLLSPTVSRVSWILKDEHGIEKDYEHFDPPMLLSADRILKRIRILTLRQMPSGTLFPKEIAQYENWVIRELLHNCIAHQDYIRSDRINLVEQPDSLLFTNAGRFIPGSVEEVISRDAPCTQYRNAFLAQAMVSLNMIDTIGSGIKRVFRTQRQRFFPMPDYDLSDADRVQVRLYGNILDEAYTQTLIEYPDLDLVDVIALDKVQKKRELTKDELARLKARKLVQGRIHNLSIHSVVYAADKTTPSKAPRIDKERYIALIVGYLEEFGEARREDLDRLLLPEMPEGMTAEQQDTKIKNLLQGMKKSGLIETIGIRKGAKWVLPDNG